MKKKVISWLLAVMVVEMALLPLFPQTVHAGAKCPECGQWNEDEYCPSCLKGECCDIICDSCGYCLECMFNANEHCPECAITCIGADYGNEPHCKECLKCENCVTLIETSNGLICEECLDLGESEGRIMCPNCWVNCIGHELDVEGEDTYDVGECGEHCSECYEEHRCPVCEECTLCTLVDICETCGICEQCAMDEGYHCPYCGACYGDAGQCPDEGDHCVNCCEDVCENCGECTFATEKEYCELCHLCVDCWAHCPVCEECCEENGECEDHGDHCRECCFREEWICAQCGRCTEALELAFCEYCGLCEECCKENSEYYGLDTCVLNEDETDLSEIDPAFHDEHHHLLRYTSSSEECHDVWCAYPGCDYYLSDCTPHEFLWHTDKQPTTEKEGHRIGICKFCGDKREETVPKIAPPVYYFIQGLGDLTAIKFFSTVSGYVQIGIEGGGYATGYLDVRVAAFPWSEGEPLPEGREILKNVYHRDAIDYPWGKGHKVEQGRYKITILATSDAYEGKYVGYKAQGTTGTWRLAVYDRRGGGVTYSEPFTLDWHALHETHTFEYVWGPLDPHMTLSSKNWSYNSGYFNDGTYHWMECTTCGQVYPVADYHRYKLVKKSQVCNGGTEHYICRDCGHRFDLKISGDYVSHDWGEYEYDDDGHFRTCKRCGFKASKTPHDVTATVSVNTCAKRITLYECKDCNYKKLERETGSHQFSNDGQYNGWYGNPTKHWKVCLKCGFVNESAHSYVQGACSVCGMDKPQFAVVGSLCVHGGSLAVQLMDDLVPEDKAKFLAGQYNVTWIDESTDATLGLGQTYELSASDVGRHIRAEIQIFNGGDYYGFLYDEIKENYVTVPGYPATCATEGLKSHVVCLQCGKKFVSGQLVTDVTIPKTNDHTYTNDCDPICNVCGFERKVTHTWSDKYAFSENEHHRECTVCGAMSVFEPHELTVTLLKQQTCKQDGLIHKVCFCGYDEDEAIPAEEHKLIAVEETKATCVAEGLKAHFSCPGCGELALDEAGKETVGVNKLKTPINPENHVGGPLGYDEEEHYTICACGKHIEKAPHTFDETDRCTVCHYRKGSDVKTGVANLTEHQAVAATCVATGMKAHYSDASGKLYLSPAGIVAVKTEDITIPKCATAHVGGPYAYSKTEHWIDCACGMKIETADHSFDEKGLCTVCGFQQKSFPWWILLVLGGVVLFFLSGIVVLIIILIVVNKKKKKEKETNQN
ncbi:MAG: hypothetical protein IK088_02695 [Lachnospiraceae bacterium]|nr:hypothetical protein [Lachnospiraceae bacterium]